MKEPDLPLRDFICVCTDGHPVEVRSVVRSTREDGYLVLWDQDGREHGFNLREVIRFQFKWTTVPV